MYGRAFLDGAGDAPPVVLVHGVGVSGRYMLPTARALAPAHQVYVPDLPGFGRSTRPPHIHNIPELADDLAAWLEALALAQVCLVGNSLGCQVIVDLVLRYPRLATSAVLIGPTVDPAARSVLAQVARGGLDMLGEPVRYWPLLIWDYLRAGTIRTLVTLHHGVQDPIAEKLPRVSIPTLVIRGTRDPIAAQTWVEEMVRLLPCGQLLVLPGATHAANFSAADRVAQAIREFLRASRCEPANGAVQEAIDLPAVRRADGVPELQPASRPECGDRERERPPVGGETGGAHA